MFSEGDDFMKQAYNPYLPSWEYIPDGEPYVFGDRVYVYGSHDRFGGEKFCMNDYVCWSASVDNLADWRYEGVIYRKDQDPRNYDGKHCLYAPDVQKGLDGRYYLYYVLDDIGIMSVAVCDTPAGAYKYYGTVKYSDGTPVGEKKGDIYQFDPSICIDDDGRIFLYSGFGTGEGAEKYFGGRKVNGLYCMELEEDMITVKRGPELLLHTRNLIEGKEDHSFFEASSMRKIGGKYYLIYSSCLSHELCYMISDRPDGGFVFGGTIISNGDIGYGGRTYECRLNHIGNNHGSLVNIKGQWYIFYHRHTNRHSFSRQGCAEPVTIREDGHIEQVEMTSCGLNGGPLEGTGTYPAYIACNLFTRDHRGYNEEDYQKDSRPFLTQDGGDRDGGDDQYIAGWRDGGIVGFKYFRFDGTSLVSVKIKGEGEGYIDVYTDINQVPLVSIPVKAASEYQTFTGSFPPQNGVAALYFHYRGSSCLSFKEFTLGV